MLHDSNLVRWQKMYESALHSDRLAGEIGVFVLKILLAINGGALIALMGAFQRLAENKEIAAGLTGGGRMFLWGLSAAVVAAGASYFYQSFVTVAEWGSMQREFGNTTYVACAEKVAPAIIYGIVIPLCLASFGLFYAGALDVLLALESLAALPAPN